MELSFYIETNYNNFCEMLGLEKKVINIILQYLPNKDFYNLLEQKVDNYEKKENIFTLIDSIKYDEIKKKLLD